MFQLSQQYLVFFMMLSRVFDIVFSLLCLHSFTASSGSSVRSQINSLLFYLPRASGLEREYIYFIQVSYDACIRSVYWALICKSDLDN